MDLQTEFDKTVELLESNRKQIPQINSLIDILSQQIAFKTFWNRDSLGNDTRDLITTYELEEAICNTSSSAFTIKKLLEGLKKTKQRKISKNQFITPINTVFVFTDFEKTELIGILVSNNNLQDEMDKVHKLKELVINVGGDNVLVDDSNIKNIFFNRKLISRY